MKNLLNSFFRLPGVIRDIRNYIFLIKVIKDQKLNSPLWSKNNLRADWIGRIYTVINLPPEVTLAPDLPKELWPAYLIEQSKDINTYLTSLNLHEIIMPEYKEIPNSTSYLLIYYPLFRDLTWWWIISRSIFWISVLILDSKTGWVSLGLKSIISIF